MLAEFFQSPDQLIRSNPELSILQPLYVSEQDYRVLTNHTMVATLPVRN